MHNRAVLDIGPRADPYGIHISADHDIHPDAALGTYVNIADDLGTLIDKGRGIDRGQDGTKTAKHDAIIGGRTGRSPIHPIREPPSVRRQR